MHNFISGGFSDYTGTRRTLPAYSRRTKRDNKAIEQFIRKGQRKQGIVYLMQTKNLSYKEANKRFKKVENQLKKDKSFKLLNINL